MAARPAAFFTLVLFLLSVTDLASPNISPAPSPGAPAPSPAPFVSSPSSSLSPIWNPLFPSSPSSSPAPATLSMGQMSPSPTPSLAPANQLIHAGYGDGELSDDGVVAREGARGVLSGGQKAGIVIGVLAAAALVGLGSVVYKKRQENIRRARYGYSTRLVEMT